MTVIAWDGKTLAADKQSTDFGHAYTTTKIYRVPYGLIGLCGNSAHAKAILRWFQSGGIGNWPRPIDAKECGYALVIGKDGGVRGYPGEGDGLYEVYEDRVIAVGSGRDYALAAIHLGKTAREAVEVACALDVFCGQGIDTLTLGA